MPPPESSIFVGDHIMGLVLIKFIVERHLIQEAIHLPSCRKKNPGTHLPKGRVRGSTSAFLLLAYCVCADSRASYKLTTVTLPGITSALLAKSSPFLRPTQGLPCSRQLRLLNTTAFTTQMTFTINHLALLVTYFLSLCFSSN